MTQRLVRRPLPRRQHYVAMRLFQALRRTFPITFRYRNPLAPDRTLSLRVDLCRNQEIYVRRRGRYEVEWLRLVAAAMVDAECFVDIGGHIGVYAATVAQAFPSKRVLVVEPLAENCAQIVETVLLNALANVTVLVAAVADSSGPVAFYVNPLHDGGGSIVASAFYCTGDIARETANYQRRHPSFVPVVEVSAVRLDSLLTARSVVKIDVEGGEMTVLRSGKQALRGGLVDLMVVEVQEETFGEVVGFLDAEDFDCFSYGSRLPARPEDAGRLSFRVVNLLCLRRGSPAHRRVDFERQDG